MSEHTPGPWKMVSSDDAGPTMGIKASGGRVTVVERLPDWTDDEAHEELANANLIAAAPDLLAALKEVHSMFGANDIGTDLATRIEAAIAKAKGGDRVSKQSKHERIIREELDAARIELTKAMADEEVYRSYSKAANVLRISIRIDTLERVIWRADGDKGGDDAESHQHRSCARDFLRASSGTGVPTRRSDECQEVRTPPLGHPRRDAGATRERDNGRYRDCQHVKDVSEEECTAQVRRRIRRRTVR